MSTEQTATNHLWHKGKNILIVSGETAAGFENLAFLKSGGGKSQHASSSIYQKLTLLKEACLRVSATNSNLITSWTETLRPERMNLWNKKTETGL